MKERKKNQFGKWQIIGGRFIVEQRINPKILKKKVQHMCEKEGNEVWSSQEKLQWYLIWIKNTSFTSTEYKFLEGFSTYHLTFSN